MTKVWIGIDPGLQGAIAVLTPDRIEITPMPVVSAANGRDVYDIPAFADVIDRLAVAHGARELLVTSEELLPMHMPGIFAGHYRGRSSMLVEAICGTLGVSYQLVLPQRWQRWIHAGTPGYGERRGPRKATEKERKQERVARRKAAKERSIMAAQRLFPGVSLLRTRLSRTPDDGFAEALLLARYGQLSETVARSA